MDTNIQESTISTLTPRTESAQATSAAASVIDLQSQEDRSAPSIKKQKLTSKVWNHFERITKGEPLFFLFHFTHFIDSLNLNL
jgi:hypothetical protein